MSYATLIDDVFGRNRIWLYELTRNGVVSRLTSSGSDYVDADSVLWASTPVTHTRIPDTSNLNRAETELVFPQSNTIARGYLSEDGYQDNTVKIFEEFKDQSPTARRQVFLGRVVATQPAITRLVLRCENKFTETRRKAISQVFQRPCRHALYHSRAGYGCNVTLADFQTAGTLTSLVGNLATVTEAANQADGYYSGGIISYGSPERYQLILRHVGTSLTLLGPVPDMADALAAASPSELSVNIAPGCDLSRSTCFSRFNNIENFGGFPWADETPYDGKTLF